ncbi:hypothetical protein MXB_1043 [Myxobolus squamalis]|nr:hypothetical protein MXB_1043 [Myxobolus squamalis]
MGNFHWYLKHEYMLPESSIFAFSFINESDMVFLSESSIWNCNFRSTFDLAPNPALNTCTVGVIDGDYLYITPFGSVCIPPPLSLCCCKLPFVTECIIINPEINENCYEVASWVRNDLILIVAYNQEKSTDSILFVLIDKENHSTSIEIIDLHTIVYCLSNVVLSDIFYFQSLDKSFHKVSINEKIVSKASLFMESFVDYFHILDSTNLLLNFCTQFYVTETFVLIVIKYCHLLCIPIATFQHDDCSLDSFEENFRNIENGARIVAVVPNSSNIVIIHDTISFVKKITDPNLLVQILAELNCIDATTTIYKSMYPANRMSLWYVKYILVVRESNKISAVCNSIQRTCVEIDEEQYKLVIILSKLKGSEVGEEDALKYIMEINPESKISKEHALKFIKLYVSSEVLYKKALGTYDLTLALMAAQITSRDPKEYVPYLQRLENFDPPYRNYIIDSDMKNYKKALTNIVQCNDQVEECLQFIKTHNLHAEALKLVDKFKSLYRLIGLQFAQILSEKKQPLNSAIVYFSFNAYESALSQFCDAGYYEESMMSLNLITDSCLENTKRRLNTLSRIQIILYL